MKNKSRRRLLIGLVVLLMLLCLGRAMFGGKSDTREAHYLTRADYEARRSALVNPSAMSNQTSSTLNASLRSTVEAMLPEEYEIEETFSVCYQLALFDPHSFEHWVLCRTQSGEEVAIIFAMADPEDARVMSECIGDSMARIPTYEVVFARPSDGVANFYLAIPNGDPVKEFYSSDAE